MASLDDLRFCQKYPFSSNAKRIVKELNLSLDDVSEDVLERAILLVSNASKGRRNFLEISSTELLENELLAFPVAKILVSIQNNKALFQKFSQMAADSTLYYLNREKKPFDVALNLSKDLDFSPQFRAEKNFAVSIDLIDFLKIDFFRPQMKLVNQHLAFGKIFLDEQKLSRFVSEMVLLKVLNSLPVPLNDVPKRFREIAKSISEEIVFVQKRDFEFQLQGKVNPNAFPPCYSEMYDSLILGKNLPHLARFSIATFLASIGMPAQQVIELFRKTPNFSEKMTSYQVNRISKAKLSPPSCTKLKEYGLCVNASCGSNPLKYYRDKFSELKKLEEKEKSEIESEKSESGKEGKSKN